MKHLRSLNNHNNEVLILESQILYKMNRYDDCIKIYEELIKNGYNSTEVITNYCSCFIMAKRFDELSQKLSKINVF